MAHTTGGKYQGGLALSRKRATEWTQPRIVPVDGQNGMWNIDCVAVGQGPGMTAADPSQGEVQMEKRLALKPVEMTPKLMQDLEDRHLIIRLCPNHHELPARAGETLGKSIYESSPSLGPHKLITVTVNRPTFAAFGTHPDNEEFLLIGDQGTRPLYLVISLHRKDELARRIAGHRLAPDDFVCLRVKYNDPEVSFFTMLADVPHGEAVAAAAGRAASFYVTESRDMGIDLTDFAGYEIYVP